MAAEIPTCEPDVLVAADKWQWDKSLSDYPPSEGYVLKYELAGPATLPSPIQASASSAGDYFQVRDNPSGHSSIGVRGTYTLIGYVELGGVRVDTPYRGVVEILVFDTSTATVSHAETMVELLQSALETQVRDGKASIAVQGDETRWLDIREIRRLLGEYWAIIEQERNVDEPFRSYQATFRAPR